MLEEIRNARGERLDFAFHPGDAKRRDVVVIGHGVTGNKNRPFALAVASGLSAFGIAALRFSFSGNGDSEGRFVDSTISKEVEDLGSVLDALEGWRTGYLGHSMGGAVGVIRASRDERIRLLISLAGMVDTAGFARRKFGELTPGRDVMWDKPDCPLSQIFVDDMRAIGSVAELAPRIHLPWLLVHGTADTVVPLEDTIDIHARANEPKTLVQIEGADHLFSPPHDETMVATIVSWVSRAWGTVAS